MTKPIPLHVADAFLDHNGNLVDHTIEHGKEYGDKSDIAKSIFSLFRKTNNTQYPVNLASHRYPEYTREEIHDFYNEQGVEVTIRGKTRIDLVPGEEGGKIYNYMISFPFRYIIYNYCQMYGGATATDRARFQTMTKDELRTTLKHSSKPEENYINHDVFTIINGHAINIGS